MKTNSNVRAGGESRTSEVSETTARPAGAVAASSLQRRSFLTPATHLAVAGLALSVQSGSSHWLDQVISMLVVM